MSTRWANQTTVELPSTAGGARLTGATFCDAIRKVVAMLYAECAFRRAEAELMALDDRTLKDVGLYRSEIGSVLTEHASKRRNGADPEHRHERRISN